MIKVVPDANILIRGMIGHHTGHCRQIINLALAKKILLYGSRGTYEEFCEKIRMQKFQKYLKSKIFTADKMILDYRTIMNMVDLTFEPAVGNVVIGDPDDDIYFQTAKACHSKIIVSMDQKVLNVKKYDGVLVTTATNFIESFAKLNQG